MFLFLQVQAGINGVNKLLECINFGYVLIPAGFKQESTVLIN